MLQKIGFQPGFNKQITETTAEGQWVDGDNVRFRYGTPEKIGGWSQLGESKLTGAARALHHLVNKSGNKFSIIGTNRILYAYTGGVYYDIHPIKTTTTLSNAFSTTNGSPTVTITFSTDHGIQENDIILLDTDGTIAIEWGAYGVPETFLVYNKKILKKVIGPLNDNLLSEIKKMIR